MCNKLVRYAHDLFKCEIEWLVEFISLHHRELALYGMRCLGKNGNHCDRVYSAYRFVLHALWCFIRKRNKPHSKVVTSRHSCSRDKSLQDVKKKLMRCSKEWGDRPNETACQGLYVKLFDPSEFVLRNKIHRWYIGKAYSGELNPFLNPCLTANEQQRSQI